MCPVLILTQHEMDRGDDQQKTEAKAHRDTGRWHGRDGAGRQVTRPIELVSTSAGGHFLASISASTHPLSLSLSSATQRGSTRTSLSIQPTAGIGLANSPARHQPFGRHCTAEDVSPSSAAQLRVTSGTAVVNCPVNWCAIFTTSSGGCAPRVRPPR